MRISQRLNSAFEAESSIPCDSPFRDITIRMASNLTEYNTAFRIAYEAYYAQGYAPYSSVGLRAMPYHFRPQTVIFLAYHKGRAVASLSLFEDGDQGLPSDCGWRTNLDGLRETRKNIFEVGSLMVVPDCPLRGPGICLALFRQSWLYARSLRGGDTLCAFVVARHAFFYEKLNFKHFAPTQSYHWNDLNVPSIAALSIDLDTAEGAYKRSFNHFGNSPRNLYQHFVTRGRDQTERQLRRESASRKSLDLQAMQRHFMALQKQPSRSSRDHVMSC